MMIKVNISGKIGWRRENIHLTGVVMCKCTENRPFPTPPSEVTTSCNSLSSIPISSTERVLQICYFQQKRETKMKTKLNIKLKNESEK